MRLIDADALMDEIAVLLERNEVSIDGWLASVLEDTIEQAPTIDAVEADLHSDGTLWIKIDHLKGVVAIKNVVLSCSRWCAKFVHEDDAVEIVRCKDCKFGEKRIGMYKCNKLDEDWDIRFDKSHYCSYGVRDERTL